MCLDPPKITVHPTNSSVELDGKIALYCNATGDPQPNFKWYKNGIAMVEASGMKPFQPVLIMEGALREDEAQYFCEASNVAGKAKSNLASLKVFSEYCKDNCEVPGKFKYWEYQAKPQTSNYFAQEFRLA